jgi:hypothetical protein
MPQFDLTLKLHVYNSPEFAEAKKTCTTLAEAQSYVDDFIAGFGQLGKGNQTITITLKSQP